MLYLPRATGVRRVFNCYVFNIKVLKRIYQTYPISSARNRPPQKPSTASSAPSCDKWVFSHGSIGEAVSGSGGCAAAESVSSLGALFLPGRRK